MINWAALGQVVAVGLVVGAGLPAVFAFGVRSLAAPRDDFGKLPVRNLALAGANFAVVVATIGLALFAMVSGGH